MIKLMFGGKCVGCEICDLILEREVRPNEYEVHCKHEKACERIEKLQKRDSFYGPGGEGRRLNHE